MQTGQVILWGFAGTIVLTLILAAARPMGLTRFDLPFLLGTMITKNRNKASWIGFLIHLLIGWLFAALYATILFSASWQGWGWGAAIGLIHGGFVLTTGIEIISSFHPRMAQPYQGPTPTRQLQPPGFLAKNYGKGTPLVTLAAHLVYGAILGAFLH